MKILAQFLLKLLGLLVLAFLIYLIIPKYDDKTFFERLGFRKKRRPQANEDQGFLQTISRNELKELYEKGVVSPGTLFPFMENERWGYFHPSGKIIIPAKFEKAFEFEEDLALVRENGLYGYIGIDGEYIIPPQFGMAFEFREGRARAYLEEKPVLVSKSGEIIFRSEYAHAIDLGNGFVKLKSEEGLLGLARLDGEVVIAPQFAYLGPISNGVMKVKGPKDDPKGNLHDRESIYEVGVMDVEGNWIVPFGKFWRISDFYEGIAKVGLRKDDREKNQGAISALINTRGEIVFAIPENDWTSGRKNLQSSFKFSNGLAPVRFERPREEIVKYKWRYGYGFITPKGELALYDPNWMHGKEFKNGRSYVSYVREGYYLINEKGEKLNKTPISRLVEHGSLSFDNGVDYVFIDNELFELDYYGNLKALGIKLFIQELDFFIRKGKRLYWNREFYTDKVNQYILHGVIDITTGEFTPPRVRDIKYVTEEKQLIRISGQNSFGYINSGGKLVYSSPYSNKTPRLRNKNSSEGSGHKEKRAEKGTEEYFHEMVAEMEKRAMLLESNGQDSEAMNIRKAVFAIKKAQVSEGLTLKYQSFRQSFDSSTGELGKIKQESFKISGNGDY